ncbi:hypothetical protein Phum_PHUM064250 [Pediculus humanus corporis]|uniref:Uncharacterized protein n=1 Tax=Pediculus humanus subsp. corporis TaxID=121224 RepID=E0VBL3_PEDHC|nr:uncharacterized protein Phum_PHUM064250 [Pediculus humanus corporis]EEB10769.1 hypothetical protein Phum_PHUM064250 [Pediculus humanus corporis]
MIDSNSASFRMGKEIENEFKTEIDEDLVRKAETVADEDLIKGLNMIIKNNETLENVMKEEGIVEIP